MLQPKSAVCELLCDFSDFGKLGSNSTRIPGTPGRGYFTERNALENTEQLCKSSLQCLISTNCTPMDRARRVLHAGNHIVGT